MAILRKISNHENERSTIHRSGRTLNFFEDSSGLRTTVNSAQSKEAAEYKSVLGFSKYMDGCVFCDGPQDKTYLDAINVFWRKFEGLLEDSISIHAPIAIEIGEAYGYKQYVSPLLIGPLE